MSSVTSSASARDTIPSLSVSNFFSTSRNASSGTSFSRFRLSGTGSVTVTVHETETSPLSAETAVTTAVPAEAAVTVTDVPVESLSVTAPLSTLQFTAGFEASSGTTATLNICVPPTVRETGCSTAGVGVSPVTGVVSGTGSVTVTVHETETSLLSAETAVTTAVPAEAAVTVTDVPVESLSVTAPLSTLQFTAGFEASSGTTATLNICVPPTVRETGCSTAGVGVSPVTGVVSGTGSVTVTVQTAVRLLFSATTAFTSASPAAIAVTFPSFTVTIFSFELSQRTF